MATITSAGVGSGIDIESMITQLMALEREPLNNIEAKQQSLSVQISAFGEIKSAMSSLETLAQTLGSNSQFGAFVASSSDEEVFTVSAIDGASTAEQHSIEVLQLAQSHRLVSGAYADADTAVGTGSYSFSSGTDSFNVTIDADNNSLSGLRDAINDAADNTNIRASILNVDGGSRLVLTAIEGGTENLISSSFAGFTQLSGAADAEFTVDGLMVTRSSNTITDVVPGVSITLNDIGTGELNSERDQENLNTTLDEFVTQYNSLISTLNSLNDGTLSGDNLPRTIESALRDDFFTPLTLSNGEEVSPYALGFTFDEYGVLSIDESTLSTATESDIEGFIRAFSETDNGFADRIEQTLALYTDTEGMIDTRTDGLQARSDSYDWQIDSYEYRLEQIETRYRTQFTAMDTLVAELQATSSYLTSQLASLVGNNNS